MRLTPGGLAGLVLAAALTGCASMVMTGAADGGDYRAPGDARSSAQAANDEAIVAAINRRYVHEPALDALDIHVDCRNGVVVLQGTVPSVAAAGRAAQLARGVHGVRRVVSRLRVAR